MKCVISGVNIKVFARAVHSLARLGDELYVEPGVEGVSFHTVNSSRSAFASFVFGCGFFSQYDGGAGGSDTTSGEGTSADASEAIKCKVAMKAFLSAFKSLSAVEKSVERCKITLDSNASRLLLQLSCRHSVVRTYNISFIECETLKAVFDESSCTHRIASQSRLLSDVFVNFKPGQDEVSLSVTTSTTTVRNYVDDEPDLSKVIRTELHLEGVEFDEHAVSSNCEVVFCLKELRALLAFSEAVNLPVSAQFSQPGSPIIFSVDNKPLFESKFVLATLVSRNLDSQASTVAAAAKAPTASRAPTAASSRKNTTEQHHTVTHHDAATAAAHNQTCSVDELREQSTTNGITNQDSITRLSTPSKTCIAINERESLNCTSVSNRNNNALVNKRLSYMPKSVNINGNNGQPQSNLTMMSEPSRETADTSVSKCRLLPPQFALNNNNNTSAVRDEQDDINETFINDITADQPDDSCVYPARPLKKRKCGFIFQRCFNSTYDPSTMPGYDVILSRDSDPED